MSPIEVIQEKIRSFQDDGLPPLFERDLELGTPAPPNRGNLVQVVTGVRRCGKTYRLYQEMRRLVADGIPLESLLYFNFEDERLKPYDSGLPAAVVETFFAMNPAARGEGAYFFFDEIQEVPDWGTFLRRMVDTQRATIYVTGSSSRMLSSNLASEFRGRALSRELFPLSFGEFVRFHGVELPSGISRDDDLAGSSAPRLPVLGERSKDALRNLLPRYLTRGGFIAVQGQSSRDAIQLLQEYAFRTVNMDIIERYGLTNVVAATQFLSRCLASSGRELSVNKTYQALRSAGVSVSRESLQSLLAYYEESYLLFSVRELSRSLAENPRTPSKVYAVDPGMQMAFSPSASQDEGQRLETAVFDKLRRRAGSLRSGSVSRLLLDEGSHRHEVDFVVGDALLQEAYQLVQVSTSLALPKTRRREVDALRVAMRRYGVGEGWIVTLDESEELDVDEGLIHVVPAWRWLL